MADVPLRTAARGGAGLTPGRIALIAVIGLVALFVLQFDGISRWVSGLFAGPERLEPGHVRILVAARNIPAYAQIEPHMVIQVVKQESALQGEEVLRQDKDVLYRVTLEDITPGTAFRERMFAPRGTKPGINAGIPPGWGAVTLSADGADGPMQHLNTGDRVAVLAVWSEGAGAAPHRASLVSRDSKVLLPLRSRAGGPAGHGGGNPLVGHGSASRQTVIAEFTLAMPPDDLIRLAEAQAQARLRIVLLSGIRGGDTFEFSSKAGAQDAWIVELIHGDRTSVSTVRPDETNDGGKDE